MSYVQSTESTNRSVYRQTMEAMGRSEHQQSYPLHTLHISYSAIVLFMVVYRMSIPEDKTVAYKCQKCGDCCRTFYFKMKLPTKDQPVLDFLQFRHKVTHGYWILQDDILYLYIPIPCDHLTPNNLCDVYEDRPLICHRYWCKKAKEHATPTSDS